MVTSYTSSSSIWCDWNISYETTGTASTIIWDAWVSSGTSTTYPNVTWTIWNGQAYNSNALPEEYHKEVRKTEKERLAKEKVKEEKARQLLREMLTDEQDAQFEEKGYFELTSVKSGNRYRINRGRTRNVEMLKADGSVAKRLCFHPEEYVHNYDTLVAQKLMLENYEEEVRKVANYS